MSHLCHGFAATARALPEAGEAFTFAIGEGRRASG
jgi:hypothetical protein